MPLIRFGVLLMALLISDACWSQSSRVKAAGAFDSPVLAVQVLVPQTDLYVQPFDSKGGASISLAGAAIGDALHRRRVSNQAEALGTLNAALDEVDVGLAAASAALRHLEGVLGISADQVEVRIETSEALEAELSKPPAPGVLRVTVEYYLSWEFSQLRVRTSAELYRESGKRAKPVYYQRLWSVWTAPKRSIGGRDDKYMAYWTSLDPDLLRSMLGGGIEQSFVILGEDLPKSVQLGMQRGPRQYGFSDGGFSSFGVIESRGFGRMLLRLRNGFLANLPEAPR